MKIYDWQIDVLRRVVDGENWCPHEHEIVKGEDEDLGAFTVWVDCKDPEEPRTIDSVRILGPSSHDWSSEIRLFMKTAMERHEREVTRNVLAHILGELEDQNTTDKRLARVEDRLGGLEDEVRYLMQRTAGLGPIA